MRSRNFLALLAKEWRELLASRAYWLLLLMMGPLVGQGFITAVGLYAEASGIGGAPAALPQALTPLDGILVPTLGAYDLAATLLFPFVAIRMLSTEKETGGLKLLLQLPGSLAAKITAKSLTLLCGWLVTLLPGLAAMMLWKSYGGHLYAPETANLLFGHLLRVMLSAGIAFAAAALAESAASAAIVTLGITLGTWALDFIAAGRGGWLQQLANYTPTAALRSFEQGLLRLNTVLVIFGVSLAGFALATIWLHTGRRLIWRALTTACVAVLVAGLIFGVMNWRASWDLSENRRNSFPATDEALLRQIHEPLHMTVYLSPEDPRLTDLEQNVLKKLRRLLPQLEVDYAAGTRTGLFENAADHYGEVWYEMGGQKLMERSTIEPVVLEQIYTLAGLTPPPPTQQQQAEESDFPGYPLAAQPVWAAWLFYGLWPLLTIFFWWLIRR